MKLPNKDLYCVYNTNRKERKTKGTTVEKATKSVRLLHAVDPVFVPTRKK